MLSRVKAGETAQLRQYWKRWTKTVGGYALRRRGRAAPEAFVDLRRRLLVTCRDLTSSALGEEKEFYEHLEGLVRPWAAPEVLARTDRELLYDLMLRCQEAERRLCGNDDGESTLGFAVKLTAAVVAGVVVALLTIPLLSRELVSGWPERLGETAGGLGHALQDMGDTTKMLLIGGALGLTALALVSRAARR